MTKISGSFSDLSKLRNDLEGFKPAIHCDDNGLFIETDELDFLLEEAVLDKKKKEKTFQITSRISITITFWGFDFKCWGFHPDMDEMITLEINTPFICLMILGEFFDSNEEE